MRLVHYSASPELGELRTFDAPSSHFMKPPGLWVSDDDCKDNWPSWCRAEDFGLDRLAYSHVVHLAEDANVLVLGDVTALDKFDAEFHKPDEPLRLFALDWARVMQRWDGLVITPYIWQRRLDLLWYYGWDCASGVIWRPRAILSVTRGTDAAVSEGR